MKLQIGSVVMHQGNWYIYSTGPGFGENCLIPIKLDETRPLIGVTEEMESNLLSYIGTKFK